MESKLEQIEIKSAEEAASYLSDADGVFIRRKPAQKHISELMKDLERDKTFLMPIIIGEYKNTLHVIVGQHRLLAIQKYFEVGNKTPIKILAKVYRGNLSKKEIIEIYTKEAKHRSEGVFDRVLIQTQNSRFFNMLTTRIVEECKIIVQPNDASKRNREFLYSRLAIDFYRARNGLPTCDNFTPVIAQINKYGEEDYQELKECLILYKHLHLEREGIGRNPRFFEDPYIQVFFYLYMVLKKKKGSSVANQIMMNSLLKVYANPKRFYNLDGEFKQLRGGKVRTRRWYEFLINGINRDKLMDGAKLPSFDKFGVDFDD